MWTLPSSILLSNTLLILIIPRIGQDFSQMLEGKISSTLVNLYNSFADLKWNLPYITLLLIFEGILSFVILKKVPYTEIDWEAYMQEVSMWQEGQLDYTKIYGGTGPLVYPAGFLYIYAFFKWLTDNGTNIAKGQVLFSMLYIINQAIVLSIYHVIGTQVIGDCKSRQETTLQRSHTIWSWRIAMAILCFSKRIHSIFILRLFNDGVCMLLFYVSCLLFMKSRWRIGCVFFSLAVSVKMNVLLFAPGLLLLLLQSSENVVETIINLAICASIQLFLGAPFLLSYPVSYLRKAFEFDRVFFYKWTVNWKFLSEDVFLSKKVSLTLLLMHLVTLGLFGRKIIKSSKAETGVAIFQGKPLNPAYVAHTLFISNFIGIAFARTLHYQFYSWYFHSLPAMLWLTNLNIMMKCALLMMIEYAFNVFPATSQSSAALQVAHIVCIASLYFAKVPKTLKDCVRKKED